MKYTLYCVALDYGDPFPVEVNKAQTVGDLKDKIMEKNKCKFTDFDANELTLYLLNIGGLDKQKRMEEIKSRAMALHNLVELDTLHKLAKYFPDPGPREETIHILVKPPHGKSIDP